MIENIAKTLNDICDLAEDWNTKTITSEEEFMDKIKPLAKQLRIDIERARVEEKKPEEVQE